MMLVSFSVYYFIVHKDFQSRAEIICVSVSSHVTKMTARVAIEGLL